MPSPQEISCFGLFPGSENRLLMGMRKSKTRPGTGIDKKLATGGRIVMIMKMLLISSAGTPISASKPLVSQNGTLIGSILLTMKGMGAISAVAIKRNPG